MTTSTFSLCYQLYSTQNTAVQNQQLFEKKLCNQSSYYENLQIISIMNGSHHVPTTKSTLFAVRKDEWDTKEGTVSPWRMHCLYSGMAKGTSQAVEQQKIKPVTLAIVKLC